MAARLLLLQRLLALRDGAGPFTLLLDSLEQPARPVVDEVLARAKVGAPLPALARRWLLLC